jgi:hypothetical protein
VTLQNRKTRNQKLEIGEEKRREKRFLSAKADGFAGAKREEKASACSVRNDGCGWVVGEEWECGERCIFAVE